LLSQQHSAQQKPNIVYILADDLGYADIGANGQKITETPNIDALAKKGINLKSKIHKVLLFFMEILKYGIMSRISNGSNKFKSNTSVKIS